MNSASKRPLPSGDGASGWNGGHSTTKKTKMDVADDDFSSDEISMSLIDEMDTLEEEELMRAGDNAPRPPSMPATNYGGASSSASTTPASAGVGVARQHPDDAPKVCLLTPSLNSMYVCMYVCMLCM